MAPRGRKPTPTFLKLVTGNPGHRPVVADKAVDVPADADNGLEPPKKLKIRQRVLWDSFVRRAPWLTQFDGPKAFLWVELQVQFENDPVGITASRIAQLRAIGNELGLDPSSRSRLGPIGGGETPTDPADAYF